MKILYIGTEYMDRRLKYAEMMMNLGHDVHILPLSKKTTADEAIIKHITQIQPDLVFLRFIETFKCNPLAQEYLISQGIPTMLYATYQPAFHYEEYDETVDRIDFPFLHNLDHVEYLTEKGINAFYMPVGFYPEQYFDMSDVRKDIPVSFAGNVRLPADPEEERRIKYIQPLAKYGMQVFGAKFQGQLTGIPVHSYDSHAQQREIYGRSKINLDIPNIPPKHEWFKDKMHVKNRLFEIPATKNFLLELRTDEMVSLMPEDTIGYYDDNTDSLIEAVERYLGDDELRHQKAEKAYKLVHEKHTFMHRFIEMFRIYDGGSP